MTSPIPSPPPPPKPQSSFPLPLELTTLIFTHVRQPSRAHIPRRKYYKSNGPRYSLHDTASIQNLRLVCKTFADAGAPLLLERVCIASERAPLDRLRRLCDEHPLVARGVRTLVYDAASYGFCNAWLDPLHRAKRSLENSNDDENECCSYCAIIKELYIPSKQTDTFFKPMAQERELIRAQAHDALVLLQTALPALPRLSKIIFWSYAEDHRWKPDLCGPQLPSRHKHFANLPIGFAREGIDCLDFRPLFNLFAALASCTPNNIRTLDLHMHISFLAAAQRVPARFAALCASFAQVRDLKLALATSTDAPGEYHDGAIHAPYPSSQTQLRALLATGLLGRLIGSCAALERLKLNLSDSGMRRDRSGGDTTTTTNYALPLTAYVGSGTEKWPDLAYLYLGSLDLTSDELCRFLVRHRRITELDLDRITLREGSWAPVSVLAFRLLRYRKVKQHQLRQCDTTRSGFAGLAAEYEQALGMGFDEYRHVADNLVWWEDMSSTHGGHDVDDTEW
ncbi:hypothetical protein EJ05DRAFT_166919 [Pseudovirgaria hyperparasitica]|uniref:Uncharacterized protein n=1 Tax=Pseudovirgaria hyperparasitica TaxID=470096 RepID=A0A6A6VV32_9PEZI|nr:uncharacterized protein EJ05DRAFT_166919 [Pseudovirgaria hyperparasitica]KAF2753646.1 hypothetical protein EJ05DRAFT_166919 [Pseudovirgaria hyperparasitica]